MGTWRVKYMYAHKFPFCDFVQLDYCIYFCSRFYNYEIGDPDLEVHPLPIGLEKYAQLLGSAQCEHRNEDLPAPIDTIMDLKEI